MPRKCLKDWGMVSEKNLNHKRQLHTQKPYWVLFAKGYRRQRGLSQHQTRGLGQADMASSEGEEEVPEERASEEGPARSITSPGRTLA